MSDFPFCSALPAPFGSGVTLKLRFFWYSLSFIYASKHPSGYLGSAVVRTCFLRVKKRDHLPFKGRKIRRLPTTNPVAVPDHFLV
jgi:hypothetical protein